MKTRGRGTLPASPKPGGEPPGWSKHRPRKKDKDVKKEKSGKEGLSRRKGRRANGSASPNS